MISTSSLTTLHFHKEPEKTAVSLSYFKTISVLTLQTDVGFEFRSKELYTKIALPLLCL